MITSFWGGGSTNFLLIRQSNSWTDTRVRYFNTSRLPQIIIGFYQNPSNKTTTKIVIKFSSLLSIELSNLKKIKWQNQTLADEVLRELLRYQSGRQLCDNAGAEGVHESRRNDGWPVSPLLAYRRVVIDFCILMVFLIGFQSRLASCRPSPEIRRRVLVYVPSRLLNISDRDLWLSSCLFAIV